MTHVSKMASNRLVEPVLSWPRPQTIDKEELVEE